MYNYVSLIKLIGYYYLTSYLYYILTYAKTYIVLFCQVKTTVWRCLYFCDFGVSEIYCRD